MTGSNMALTQSLGLLWVVIAIAYLIMYFDSNKLKECKAGISLIVMLSMPVVLFESLFTVNLLNVNYELILALAMAKTAMWCIGVVLGCLSPSGGC
jgi:hypothetical protein